MKLAQDGGTTALRRSPVENQGTAVTSAQRFRAAVNDGVDVDSQVLNCGFEFLDLSPENGFQMGN
jgi:hypothetical protein